MIQEKFRAPTKYDLEPYGTLWLVKIDEFDDAWIQVSKDPQNPSWMRFGPFLEKVFESSIDEYFIDQCLEMYENQKQNIH